MHPINLLSLAFAALQTGTWGQVVGTPYGFATGVTGGGSATPAVPSSITQLKEWLADDAPRSQDAALTPARVLHLTEAKIPSSLANEVQITVTYDKASHLGMDVGSNKSLVGKGSAGVLNGKGLRFKAGAKNVIIQNIHITNLNPQYVWGGDGISLSGNDGVWIDHVKLSKTGRQHFYDASRVTISNTEFDGVTPYSHSCNSDHYWTIIMGGTGDKITFDRNYIHDVSGRAPKIGSSSGTQLVQAVNNYFYSGTGHNFDISSSGHVLIESNYFDSCVTPLTSGSNGKIFNTASTGVEGNCASALGRNCAVNYLSSNTGRMTSLTGSTVLSELGSYKSQLVAPWGMVKLLVPLQRTQALGRLEIEERETSLGLCSSSMLQPDDLCHNFFRTRSMHYL
uniref:pectin lyase n=1 Tax=Bionectria ochroleuca TaxID=29856 RepID=A0A8H7N606_BIOOC